MFIKNIKPINVFISVDQSKRIRLTVAGTAFTMFFLRNSMSNCNRDLCRRHIPVVVNAINRLANQQNNKKYIVLDIQLPATIDPEDYTAGDDKLYNFILPRAVSSTDTTAIDATVMDRVTTENGTVIGTDGFYITPTMRHTENKTIKEYTVLDNNGGNPRNNEENVQPNPIQNQNMIYLERTTTVSDGNITSSVDPTVRTIDTNLRGLMFRINIPWSMSVFYTDMTEKTQKEYDKLVALMDNLTRFTEMRFDFLDENYENPKFESILPFKNYATSNGGKAIALTMAGSVQVTGFCLLGDEYWRFYPGGFVFISQNKPNRYAIKYVRLTLAYED